MPGSHLWNTSRLPVQGFYGGVAYPIPAGTRLAIRNHKVIDRRTGGQAEVHMAEEIASHLFADLQSQGVVLIDDEHPLDDATYLAQGKEAQAAFIRGLIDDFNALNSEIAAGGGKKILVVPKHYRALQKEYLRLMTEIGETPDAEFTSPEELKELQERTLVPRNEALNRVLKAVASGDMGAIEEAARALAGASPAPGEDSAFVGDNPEGEIVQPEPARPAAVNRRMKRRGRK